MFGLTFSPQYFPKYAFENKKTVLAAVKINGLEGIRIPGRVQCRTLEQSVNNALNRLALRRPSWRTVD